MIPPKDLEDAHILMCCHQQSVDDFQMQIDMIDIELSMFGTDQDLQPFEVDKVDELEQKKLKLLAGKRFHQNARHCSWYYVARAEQKHKY